MYSFHYNDVTMSAMVSQFTGVSIVCSTLINAPRHWHLCGEFTGNRWIPRTKGQYSGKCFHLITSSCLLRFVCQSICCVTVVKPVDCRRFLNIGQVIWDHQPGPCHFVKGIGMYVCWWHCLFCDHHPFRHFHHPLAQPAPQAQQIGDSVSSWYFVWKRISVMVCKKSAYPNCSGRL